MCCACVFLQLLLPGVWLVGFVSVLVSWYFFGFLHEKKLAGIPAKSSQAALEGLGSSSVPLMTQFGDGGAWVGVGHVCGSSKSILPFYFEDLESFPSLSRVAAGNLENVSYRVTERLSLSHACTRTSHNFICLTIS